MCSRGGLLDFENEEYLVFYLGRAQPPPSSCFYGVSAIVEFLSTGEKLFSLGPIYLLPHGGYKDDYETVNSHKIFIVQIQV